MPQPDDPQSLVPGAQLRQAIEAMLAGMAAGTILTFTAISIHQNAVAQKGAARHGTGLSTTLVGAGLGALAALLVPRQRNQPRQVPSEADPATSAAASGATTSDAPSGGWTDWRSFKVVRKLKESEEITSFHLEPLDAGALPSYLPGQFLPIRLLVPGQPRPVIRTYSLSDDPEPQGAASSSYRLSIKREPAPPGQPVPAGVASNFLHDHIQEGSIIEARPPSGSFVLDLSRSTPVVLISNGVGITPMLAMLKASCRHSPERRVWFLHGARDGRSHAFRQEVARIATQNANVGLHVAYSRPRPEDGGNYQTEGYIDVPLILSLVQGEAMYFLCGSPPFLESIRTGLKAAGVAESAIAFEMFDRAARQASGLAAATPQDPLAPAPPGSRLAAVHFERSDRTAAWRGDHENLLEFAEAEGLSPDFSCRAGVCGTCECRLLEGEVSYGVPPTAPVAPGSVLICIATPRSAEVRLDL